jgi:formylglycine-generating enzyme required for sulfatase activity
VLKAGYNISNSLKSTAVHYREQGKGIGAYEMVFVEGGTFQLGKNMGKGGGSDVNPVSNVTLRSFYIGKYEVTQSQWRAVMGSMPDNLITNGNRYGIGDAYPMYYVVWLEVLAFCNNLSMNEGLTPAYRIANSTNPIDWAQGTKWNVVTIDSGSTGYRLPTQEQWEYAAKGGNPLAPGWVGYTYAGSDNPDEVAWYSDNSEGRTHEVGTKAPNFLGLCDMSGNVHELMPLDNNTTNETGRRRGGAFDSYVPNALTIVGSGMSGGLSRSQTWGLRLARPAE